MRIIKEIKFEEIPGFNFPFEQEELAPEPHYSTFCDEGGILFPYRQQMFDFLDKIIRTTGKSVYDDFTEVLMNGPEWVGDEWSKCSDIARVKYLLYKNQLQGDISQTIENKTLVVTFDGIKGTGKTTLAKLVGKFLMITDPSVLEGQSAVFGVPIKPSEFPSEGIASEIKDYRDKLRKGERALIPDFEFKARMIQFSLALSRLAYEQPPMFFFDRSYITTLAKAGKFLEQSERELEEFYDKLKQEQERESEQRIIDSVLETRRGVRSLTDDIQRNREIRAWTKKDYGELAPFERKIIQLRYAIHNMRGRYIIPDLSITMVSDSELSYQRQEERKQATGRPAEKVDKREFEWYNFYRKTFLMPNGLYLDTAKMSQRDCFRAAMTALKERCEERGLEQIAQAITEESVDTFYQRHAA